MSLMPTMAFKSSANLEILVLLGSFISFIKYYLAYLHLGCIEYLTNFSLCIVFTMVVPAYHVRLCICKFSIDAIFSKLIL